MAVSSSSSGLKTYPEILKLTGYNLTLHGWSRGSQNTGFMIPELKLLLDAQSRSKFNPEFIFITHGHTDHCFSLPMRILNIPTNPLVLVPDETRGLISDFINATFRMGYADPSYQHTCHLVGVIPGQVYQLKNSFQVKVYDMVHNVPCRGYGLQITKNKLKPEYSDCSKEELIALRKNHAEIMGSSVEPVLAYLTDTTTQVFELNPELLTYPYIMIECTFVPCHPEDTLKELQLAEEAKHIHWNHLYPIIQQNPKVTFILIHFSHRYTDEELTLFKQNIKETNIIWAI